MDSVEYTLKDGAYTFPTDLGAELRLINVQRDKYSRIHAHARFMTSEGAVLGLAHGDLTAGVWRRELAAQVARRGIVRTPREVGKRTHRGRSSP